MSVKSTTPKQQPDQHEILARQGLRLPALMLKRLRACGIYCQPSISVEHQHLAKRYVLRGVESGGAVNDLGAYSSFVADDGSRLSWLQCVESVGVNGVHAIVIAPAFVRLQIVRVKRTYDLLITRHQLVPGPQPRPILKSEILFFGRRGCLEMDLWGKDADYRGIVSPVFYNRAGELAPIPEGFQRSVASITGATSCVGCGHCHLLCSDAVVRSSEETACAILDRTGSAA